MKTIFLLGITAVLGFSSSALCQSTFQNLGFEDADLSAIPPGQATFLPFSQVFPGWVGYYNGTNVASEAVFNGVSLGAPLLSLISRSTQFYTNSVIAGSYTAVLSAGNLPPNPPHIS